MVVHSKDDKEIGVTHEVKSPENHAQFFPDDDGVVLAKYN